MLMISRTEATTSTTSLYDSLSNSLSSFLSITTTTSSVTISSSSHTSTTNQGLEDNSRNILTSSLSEDSLVVSIKQHQQKHQQRLYLCRHCKNKYFYTLIQLFVLLLFLVVIHNTTTISCNTSYNILQQQNQNRKSFQSFQQQHYQYQYQQQYKNTITRSVAFSFSRKNNSHGTSSSNNKIYQKQQQQQTVKYNQKLFGWCRGSSIVSKLLFSSSSSIILNNKNNNQEKIRLAMSSLTTTTDTTKTAGTTTTTTTTTSTTTTGSDNSKVIDKERIPNWRTISNPKKHIAATTTTIETNDAKIQQQQQEKLFHHTIRSLLVQREEWSQTVYEQYLQLYQKIQNNTINTTTNTISTTTANIDGTTGSTVETIENNDITYNITEHIQSAIQVLDHSFRLYGGPDNVICSFNGGKDAVVILHLYLASCANYYYNTTSSTVSTSTSTGNMPITIKQQKRNRPRVIYFDHKNEFKEITNFLQSTVHQYDLDMISFEQGTKFQDGLQLLVQHNIPSTVIDALSISISTSTTEDDTSSSTADGKSLLMSIPSWPIGFVLGTRVGDPNADNQEQFAPSSMYMPPFMRINPIISWTYGHVWNFLRVYQLSYCILYDQGYTSLGTITDTVPCPALAIPGSTASTTGSNNNEQLQITNDTHNNNNNNTTNSSSIPKYWPAYMLRDWSQERAGRTSKTPTAPTSSTKPNVDSKGQPPIPPMTASKKSSTSSTTGTTPKGATSVASSSYRKKQINTTVTAADMSENTDYTDGAGSVSSIGGRLSTMTISRFPPSAAQVSSSSRVVEVRPDATGTGNTTTKTNNMSYNNFAHHDDDDDDVAVSYSEDTMTKSVALLIIGDEILKGYTIDLNTKVAAIALREHNVLLQRVVCISDNLLDIKNEIISLQQQVDVIITSGGVGPTHDDVTIKGISAALDCDMILHTEMAQLLIQKMNTNTATTTVTSNATDSTTASTSGNNNEETTTELLLAQLTEGQRKMATLPRYSKLRYLSNNTNDWPILQCRNIFVLPGVPQFFEQKINTIAQYLSCQLLERPDSYKVVLSIDEGLIVNTLNTIVSNHPFVEFGSYPFVNHPEYKTVITVEGKLAYSTKSKSVTTGTTTNNTAVLTSRITTGSSNYNTMSTTLRNSDIFDRRLLLNKTIDEINEMVQVALDELINALPSNSIVRVDNKDMTLFS